MGFMWANDMIHVDNQASTDADKHVAHVGQLFADHVLELTELEGHHTNLTTRNEQVAIVAIRRDIDDLGCRYAQQFVGGGYDEMSIHAD